MRSTRWFALALIVAGSVAVAEAGREGRRRGRGSKQPEVTLFDQLVRECKLTDKQQADVKAKIKARDDALAAWDKANAEKMQAAEAAAKEARANKDADARKKTSGELRALRKAREESAATATAAVLTVLTGEQKVSWAAYQLFQSTAGRYRRAELTEEQLARVKRACAFAAREIAEIDESDSKARKAVGEVNKKLRWAIDALVLTDAQRQALSQAPGRRGGKAKEQ